MERDSQYSGKVDFTRLATEFEALRALPADQRERALCALSGQQPQLTTELRRLFEQHSEDPEELASPEQAFGSDEVEAAVTEAEPDAPPPESIGPYRPMRELGRGGMGTVYLSERQDSDFTNRVAIKLLRAPVSDRDMQRRFRTERRILAGLKHPNIAAMFDGGTTDAGQPYVVMEYVDGPDLMTWCREQNLALAARLRLFIKVCRAVAHAHRALVVHRDLKPSNILVGANGEPKLLDFGIAKLLQSETDTAASIALTRTGNMLLTPEYSSPEQVRGESITTATDVYALGALLYELLCGKRAQPLQNRSLTQLIEVVCEHTAPAPSTAASDGSTTRQLRGDLDTIVACAMRKEPDRRYSSAEALADDIENHLDGLPVTAQGDSLGYRTRKFVRRHRLALAAAAAMLVLLITFAITTAVQNRRIEKERDAAVTQRIVADEISEFLVELFTMASPDPERAETLRARELLDRGARRIETELTSAPQRRAPLQLAMGRVYIALGLYDRARPLVGAAEQAFVERAKDSSAHRTAQYWCGILAFYQGRDQQGEQLMRSSLLPNADGEPVEPAELIGRQATLATWLRDGGHFDEADELLDRGEALIEKHDIRDLAARVRIARAEILRDRGQPERSLELLEELRQRAITTDGEEHPRYARLHRELGRTHMELDNLDAARTSFELALHQAREFAGDSHPDVDSALFSIAMLEISMGDLRRAETALRELLTRDEARFGEHHAYPALDKSQLARVIGELDRPEEAEPLFRESLQVQREVLPEDHPELSTTISNFAAFLKRQGRLDESAPLLNEALQLRQKIYEPDHPVVLTARNMIAVLESDRGNFAVAEREFRLVLAARRSRLGEHSETAGSLLSLATVISRQGQRAAAIPLFEESIAMFGKTLPPDHPTQARPQIGLALAHMHLERPDHAEPHAERAVAINLEAYGDRHFQTYYAEWTLARCLAQAGKKAEAIKAMRDIEARMAKTHPGHRLLGEVQKSLVSLGG